MSSTAATIRSRVTRSRPGSFFSVGDYPMSRSAAETAFSRLTAEGKVRRVGRGLYWKGVNSRFGFGRPPVQLIADRIVGARGFGPTRWSASHALGLTTQVPARPSFVVLGAVPTGIDGADFHARSNLERVKLNYLEIGILEMLRDWPRYSDEDWSSLLSKTRELAVAGKVRPERLARAGELERNLRTRRLCEQLVHDLTRAA